MKTLRKTTFFLLLLLGAGLVKLPLEKGFSQDLRERRIMPPALSNKVWSQLGQTGLAATLGGMRSVIAVGANLKAHSHFSNQEWYELERNYELITALDPYNPFYWYMGGWHLAYNAAGYSRTDFSKSEQERVLTEREYLEKGDAFFRRGLEYLPQSPSLWAAIGSLWSSPYKRPDHERAAAAWEKAAEYSGNRIYQRRYFYELAQIPKRRYEALDYGLKIVREDPYNLRLPNFRSALFALQGLPGARPELPLLTLEEIFGDKERAYRDLYNYRYRVEEEGFFAGNVDETLAKLADELQVPVALNPFLTPRNRRLSIEELRKAIAQADKTSR